MRCVAGATGSFETGPARTHVPSIESVQSPVHPRNKKKQKQKQKQKQTKQTKQTKRPTNKTAKMGASRSRCHVTGGKARQALKRPFLAALCYRYLPPCSTAGRPFTGRAPVLLWSATPCWLRPAGCGLQRLSSCCKTSTTVCGHGTHLRIFLCVSVCVVSLYRGAAYTQSMPLGLDTMSE